jgi:hypothetical protein
MLECSFAVILYKELQDIIINKKIKCDNLHSILNKLISIN